MKTYAFTLWLLTVAAHGQVLFSELQPAQGPVGTVVALNGTGFNPAAANVVSVDGVMAILNEVTPTSIRFTIAPGTASGEVKLTVNGAEYVHPITFDVLRNINGTLVLPPTVNAAGYDIVAVGDPLVPAIGTGQFTAQVPLDRPLTIWAFRSEHDPVFAAVVTPAMQTVTINAQSTALALALFSPIVAPGDGARVQSVLSTLAGLPQSITLGNFIASRSGDQNDYLEDARFESAFTALLDAYLAQPAPAPHALAAGNFKPNTPRYTWLRDLNSTNIFTRNTLESSLANPKPGVIRLTLDGRESENPLDWAIEIYELDPKQFRRGRDDVDALQHYDIPRKVIAQPILSGFVHASLLSSKADVLKVAAKFITKKAFSLVDEEALANRFEFDQSVPAIYISQSYSGNLFYGTRLFHAGGFTQAEIIEGLKAEPQWGAALAGNLFIVLIDLASSAIDVKSFVKHPDKVQRVGFMVMKDVMKTVLGHENELSKEGLYDILKAAAPSLIKALIEDALEEHFGPEGHPGGFAARLGRFGIAIGKTLFHTIDITSRYAYLSGGLERLDGAVTTKALAIERSVVVVGQPFEPVIHSFQPKAARPGDAVLLQGYNFPMSPTEVTVSFCTFNSTTEFPPVPAVELPVPVIVANEHALVIPVPPNWRLFFPQGKAFICIKGTNGFSTSTLTLEEGPREITFIPPPIVYTVTPDPVRPNNVISIEGTNFFANAAEKNICVFDGGIEVPASVASGEWLTVKLPPLAEGDHTVRVRIGNESAGPSAVFTVQEPASTNDGYAAGLTITVNKLDLSNTADGQVSLFEGMAIANGTLGRPIERHLPCESIPPGEEGHCPPRVREVDFIQGLDENGTGGGYLSRDTVQIHPNLQRQTNFLVGQWSPGTPGSHPTSGDTFDFGFLVLDGSGLSVPAAWLLDAVQGVTLRNVTFRNFTGHGIHLRNGADGNKVHFVNIEHCGGTGAYFDQFAVNNEFFSFHVARAGEHGLHMSGPVVRYNDIRTSGFYTDQILGRYENCVLNGILIDGGASFNVVDPGTVRSNGLAGILITGADTDNNLIGRVEGPLGRFCDIYANGGHGVHLTAGVEHTVMRYLNPAGNSGDGILMEGPDCAFNQVDSTIAGIDLFTTFAQPQARPNQGSGVHLRNGAHHNLIGSHIPGSFGGRNMFAGNRDDGVLIEGSDSSSNIVNRSHIGAIDPLLLGPDRYFPNGGNGIRIRDGSHHNQLGANHSFLDLHVMASTNAGILIEGMGSDFNEIFGNQIGVSHDEPFIAPFGWNRVGIHIRNGARGNVIGQMGDFLEFFDPFTFEPQVFRFANSIGHCLDAAVVLDNCGGFIDVEGQLQAPNIIQNNKIGEQDFGGLAPNFFAIKIINNAAGNVIGGPLPGQGNRIVNNHIAGIYISNNFVLAEAQRNRILNNLIDSSGIMFAGPIPDPLQAPPPGIGVMITGPSTGNIVGEAIGTANSITRNRVGVYIDNCNVNTVRGNVVANNSIAGIIIRSGERNAIGAPAAKFGNRIYANGMGALEHGGLLISGGRQNRVEYNLIGFPNNGNFGVGILLKNSGDNVIGSVQGPAGNVIIRNLSHGIHVLGAASSGNHLLNNFIGKDRAQAAFGNGGDGVRFENGANHNRVGGIGFQPAGAGLMAVPVPNEIAFNQGDGVAVIGNSTVANSIIYNAITGNGGLGIRHQAGGNFEIPPPIWRTYDGTTLTGVVPDTNRVPPGSTIHVYSDIGPGTSQGARFLGEATVRSNGTWSAALLPSLLPNMTMTATHAINGSTSEFGQDSTAPPPLVGLRIVRSDSLNTDRTRAGVNQFPVLRLSLTAVNAPVRISAISFNAAGSLDDAAQITAIHLYHDTDRDGSITAADVLLDVPITYSMDDGQINFTNLNVSIPANTTRGWLLAYTLASSIPDGTTFQVSVENPSVVDARFIYQVGAAVTPTGPFPLRSPLFTVTEQEQQTLNAWKAMHFDSAELANPAISGNDADPDGDGVNNLLEYAYNLDPRLADRAPFELDRGLPVAGRIRLFDADSQMERDYFTLTYLRRKSPVDLSYSIELSDDLLLWFNQVLQADRLTLLGQEDIGDGSTFEKIILRSTMSIAEPISFPEEFFRVRVQWVP